MDTWYFRRPQEEPYGEKLFENRELISCYDGRDGVASELLFLRTPMLSWDEARSRYHMDFVVQRTVRE